MAEDLVHAVRRQLREVPQVGFPAAVEVAGEQHAGVVVDDDPAGEMNGADLLDRAVLARLQRVQHLPQRGRGAGFERRDDRQLGHLAYGLADGGVGSHVHLQIKWSGTAGTGVCKRPGSDPASVRSSLPGQSRTSRWVRSVARTLWRRRPGGRAQHSGRLLEKASDHDSCGVLSDGASRRMSGFRRALRDRFRIKRP